MTGETMDREEFFEKYPDKSFGKINVERQWDSWEDDDRVIEDEGWEIYLGHSCDEWIIGGVKEAEKFALDLAEAIKYCNENP